MIYKNRVEEKSPMNKFTNCLKKPEFGCDVFCVLMLGIFPIFLTEGLFFTLNVSKYLFLIFSSAALLLYYIFSPYAKKTMPSFKKIPIPDWAMIGLCLVYIISGLLSSDFTETINGADGRFNGIVTILCYTIIYFVITRYGRLKPVFFYIFAISSSLVFLLGILNFFQIDPLNAYANVKASEREIFLSTIGNRNFFSAFVCIGLPIFATLFCLSKTRWKTIVFAVATVLGEFALFIGNSDSGFVGMVIVFFVLPFFLFDNYISFRRYIMFALTFFASSQIIDILISNASNEVGKLSGISNLLMNNRVSIIILIFLALMSLVLYIFPVGKKLPLGIIKKIFVGTITLLIVIFLISFFYFSIIDKQTSLGDFENYLRFSPNFGSNRGSVWIALLTAFISFPIVKIFIGNGPDTIYQVLLEYYPNEIRNGSLLPFDSAHNEYLHYLITTGLIGLSAYCTLVGVLISWALRRAKKSEFMLPLAASALCYAVQGFFNISVVSVTPLFFLVLSFIGIDYYQSKLNKSLN